MAQVKAGLGAHDPASRPTLSTASPGPLRRLVLRVWDAKAGPTHQAGAEPTRATPRERVVGLHQGRIDLVEGAILGDPNDGDATGERDP